MEDIYKNLINERIEQYGTSTLTEKEAISALTGIPLTNVNMALETYGIAELIKYSKSLNLTKAQNRKLELLFYCKAD